MWAPSWLTTCVVIGAVALAACGDDDSYYGAGENSETNGAEIKRTSSNTFIIMDDDGYPHNYLDKTCQTIGREVVDQSTPADFYGWLYVTCTPEAHKALDSYTDTP